MSHRIFVVIEEYNTNALAYFKPAINTNEFDLPIGALDAILEVCQKEERACRVAANAEKEVE